ncbi:hypothetical protein CS537_01935 [Yersinia mollaretii]|nr:hypothetical protein CS537_01935 [Yersinia mollaretii]
MARQSLRSLLISIQTHQTYGLLSIEANFPNKLNTLTHIDYLKNCLVVLVIYYVHRFFNCSYRGG